MYFYDVPAWYMNCELMFLLLVPFFYALCRANILWYAAVLAFLFLTAFALYSHVPEGIPREAVCITALWRACGSLWRGCWRIA